MVGTGGTRRIVEQDRGSNLVTEACCDCHRGRGALKAEPYDVACHDLLGNAMHESLIETVICPWRVGDGVLAGRVDRDQRGAGRTILAHDARDIDTGMSKAVDQEATLLVIPHQAEHGDVCAKQSSAGSLVRGLLSEVSRFLEGRGLADLLTIGTAELTDENPADLGETGYLQWLIDRERAGQYVTWKQELLDLMRLYLSEEGADADRGAVLRLGTTSYYHAWEVACKAAFGDLLGHRLRKLPLITLADEWATNKNGTLLQIIPRPIWKRSQEMGNAGDVDTLIPDIVTFAEHGGRRLFCIYDAKYYVPSRRGKTVGQPGVESVTKQFLYQSGYQRFVEDHGFDAVVNAFLVPTEGDEPEYLASVSFPGVMSAATGASSKFSDRIDMWALTAREVFDCYLTGRRLDENMVGIVLTRQERDENNSMCAVMSHFSYRPSLGLHISSSTIVHVHEPLPMEYRRMPSMSVPAYVSIASES